MRLADRVWNFPVIVDDYPGNRGGGSWEDTCCRLLKKCALKRALCRPYTTLLRSPLAPLRVLSSIPTSKSMSLSPLLSATLKLPLGIASWRPRPECGSNYLRRWILLNWPRFSRALTAKLPAPICASCNSRGRCLAPSSPHRSLRSGPCAHLLPHTPPLASPPPCCFHRGPLPCATGWPASCQACWARQL